MGEIRRDQSDSVENERRCCGPVPSHLPGQAYRLANEIVGDFAWAPELLAPGTTWWDASTAIYLLSTLPVAARTLRVLRFVDHFPGFGA